MGYVPGILGPKGLVFGKNYLKSEPIQPVFTQNRCLGPQNPGFPGAWVFVICYFCVWKPLYNLVPWAGASISWIEISAAAAPNIWWWGARAGAAWAQGRTIFCCGLEAMAMLTLILVVARAWLQQQSSARAHPSTRIFPKKYNMNTHDSTWLRMDRAWSTMGALHRPPQSQDHAHVEDHAHIRARTRIRTRTHRTASAPRSISICEKVSRPR